MERKLATVLFVDLVGSTEFVAARDPEIVRRRVNSFFEQVAHCVATHGGIVEKFAGDAVMAAFGIPQAHEDDAERAVRAAAAVLESVHGLGLEARIGVEAGEVVADESDSTFATGEAVNVAARLQQLAAAGRDPDRPLRAAAHARRRRDRGGRAARPEGFRRPAARLAVHRPPRAATGSRPSVAAPFVAREYELELLENTLARVRPRPRAHLFTIYGEPGVGKSRLAREFIEGVERRHRPDRPLASVRRGRHLLAVGRDGQGRGGDHGRRSGPGGDREAARALRRRRRRRPARARRRRARGDRDERSQQEIAWAAREWAAELADARPLILVFEDVHWAEEPLLELIEHLAERVKDAPLMIVCLARPELLDIRPAGAAAACAPPRSSSSRSRRDESEELLDALLADRELSTSERKTLLEKTEGNPLFVEETTRMLLEGGDLRPSGSPTRCRP